MPDTYQSNRLLSRVPAVQAWLHRLDRIMSRHQRSLWWVCLVIVAVLLIGTAFLIRGVGQDVATFRDAGKRDRIASALAPEGDPIRVPRPSTVPKRDPSNGDDESDPDEFVDYNWHSTPRLRKAAAALAREGDLESAVALLAQAAADDAGVRAVAETALGSLRFHFTPVANEELKDLRKHWLSLDATGRERLFIVTAQGKREKLNTMLQEPVPAAKLSQCMELLPVSLQYWLMVNLHNQLTARSKCPGPVVELILESEFKQDGLAKKLYWKHLTETRIPVADHAKRFATDVNAGFLWSGFQELYKVERRYLKEAERPEGEWFRKAIGEEFAKGLLSSDPAKMVQRNGIELWEALNEPMRKFWSDSVYRAFALHESEWFSPAELSANPWLVEAAASTDSSFLAAAVRDHPLWQRSLSEFDHYQAEKSFPEITKRLRASKYDSGAWRILKVPLYFERKELLKKSFTSGWRYLANSLRISDKKEQIPPGIQSQKARAEGDPYERAKVRGRRWRDVPPAEVYSRFVLLARRKSEGQTVYRMLARNYAINRGLQLKDEKRGR